jgi:hypothetical protein
LADQERKLREAEQRKQLNLEARRKCVELQEKKRASGPISCEAANVPDETRLRAEVQYRFKIVNPSASESEFESYWETILDDLSRQRAQQLLAEKMKELYAQTQY